MMLLPRKQAGNLLFSPTSISSPSPMDSKNSKIKSCSDGEVVAPATKVHQKPVFETTPECPSTSGTGEHSRPLSPGRLVMNGKRS